MRWIGHRTVDLLRHPRPDNVRPVRIAAGALEKGLPVRDLIVSPDHALLVSGALLPARLLLNGHSIRPDRVRQDTSWLRGKLLEVLCNRAPAGRKPVYRLLSLCYRLSMNEPTMAAHQIAAAQTKLRAALGLPPEEFPLSSFISMVSDEIEQLRAQGRSDAEIAEMIGSFGEVTVSAEDVSRHYASREARGRAHR